MAGVVTVAFFAGRFYSQGDIQIAGIKQQIDGLGQSLNQHTVTDDQLRSEIETARAERFKQLGDVQESVSFNNGRIEALKEQVDELDMRLRDLEKQVRK